jgi:hypothetical protein
MASYADLIAAFKAKAARGNCTWCDANDWTVVGGTDKFAAIHLSNLEGISTSEGVETVAFSCKNCGRIEFHLTSVLGQSLDKR